MSRSQSTTESSVIDFEALKARCLGNLGLVERVLAKFTNQLDADLAELQQAVAAGNAADAAKLAHRIKGMSASIEARQLHEDASLAEQEAMAGAAAELRTRFEQMDHDRDQLAKAIERIRHLAEPTRPDASCAPGGPLAAPLNGDPRPLNPEP